MALKSLNDFNNERLAVHDAENTVPLIKNGIACPSCGKELVDSNPNQMLLTDPPQKQIECGSCEYTGHRYC